MKVIKWIGEEILKVLPAVIYFGVAFNLIFFITGFMLRPDDTRYLNYFTVTLGAIIVGKVMLLVNAFSFINAFSNKPLIYNILWKFVIYSVCVIIAAILEDFLDLFHHWHDVHVAFYRVQQEFASPLFWGTVLWLLLVFFLFVLGSDVIDAVGRKRMFRLLFVTGKLDS